MSVKHIVLVHAAPNGNQENLSRLFSSVIGLKDRCTRNGQRYIKSITGGVDNSVEGMQAGITHVLMVEFESRQDRDYYAQEDPIHREVAQGLLSAIGIDITTAQVVDFTPGAF